MQKIKPYIGYIAAFGVFILALVSFGHAQVGGGYVIQNIENAVFGGGGTVSTPDESLGAGSSHITSDTTVSGTLSATATSTFQEVTQGSRFVKTLTFSQGATSTFGGLGSLQNTGSPKICTNVWIDLSTGISTNAYNFSIASSTSATALSSDRVSNIMASTTSIVGQPMEFSMIGNPGNDFPRGDKGIASTTPFVWDNGEYIAPIFGSTVASAARENYTSAVGKMYLNCYSR